MTVDQFFSLFMNELARDRAMHHYYKFLQSQKRSVFDFRKYYFIRRLEYIYRHIGKPRLPVWDCGCGYGTTGLFLAMNNIAVVGSTFEFYYDQIEKRKQFWSQYGDTSLFTVRYENIFDINQPSQSHEIILVQDTLHHLEPIGQAFEILSHRLTPQGKILVTEENGQNLFLRLKLYLQRGNKRVVRVYDDRLGKEILLGNENIRSIKEWKRLANKHSLEVRHVEFYRLFWPPFYRIFDAGQIKKIENKWVKFNLLRNYFYWGLNFIMVKKNLEE